MLKKLAFSAAITLMSSGAVHILDTGDVAQVQTPCHDAGHIQDKACVMVHRFVSGSNPTVQLELDTHVMQKLKGQKTFSVIYAYQVKKNRFNGNVSALVSHGKKFIMSDIYVNRPTLFWVSTRDGGKTWSKPMTTDMSDVISN